MGSDDLQGCLFADSQEWDFQAVIRSDKRSTLLQEFRIAEVHE